MKYTYMYNTHGRSTKQKLKEEKAKKKERSNFFESSHSLSIGTLQNVLHK